MMKIKDFEKAVEIVKKIKAIDKDAFIEFYGNDYLRVHFKIDNGNIE